MSEPTAIIELEGVDVVHEEAPERVLVRGVSWRIGRGQFWCVGGDSASGKTSLLATAASLNRPAAGTLRMFGQDLATASEAEQVDWRRRIGFVYEGGGRLFSHLTVAENVALPLRYHTSLGEEEVAARVAELLARAELTSLATARPSRLPPRLQQRVALMRALAVPTEVLFLDNPLGGLGPRERRWWVTFLRELRAEHDRRGEPLTVVATAGDFRGWLDVAEQFALLQNQQLRILGSGDQLAGIEEPSVKELLSSGL